MEAQHNSMMKKRGDGKDLASTSFAIMLHVIVVLLFMMACSPNKKQNPFVEVGAKESAVPTITLLSQLSEKDRPHVILLDTVPKPTVINVPARDRTIRSGVESNSEKNIQKQLAEKETTTIGVVNAEGRGFFTTFTTDDGLSLDQVYCSYKDEWGNLWFGTNGGGVSKYDGKNFTTYTTAHGLASNVIWCITQDHDGNLWFGTDGSGVSKYDGESFTNYTTAQGLPDNVIFSIVEDQKNNLWFGTLKGGVSKWNGKTFINYSTKDGLTNNAVKTILEDSKRNLWFGTIGGGVSKWNGETFTNYTTKEGLSGKKIWSVAEDNSGNLWFGTEGKGLSKYDGKVFTNYPVFSEPANDGVLCIAKDKQGVLWLGTQKSGVIKYDGRTFLKYSTANGLANNQIRAVTEDEKGNLWFGSFGSGICKFAGNGFTNFTTEHGLSSNVIFSIEEGKEGNLWLGTSGGGVCRYDGKQFANFTKAYGLAHNEIYCVLKDSAGNLWFGTAGGGVTKYNGKSFTNYTTLQGLANNVVFSIAEDKKGNLWFGTSGGGVSKYDGKSFTNYTPLQGLAGNVVFSIKEDKDANLWFGTLGGGVSKFDGTGFTNYTVEQGLSDNVVWAVTEDKQGNLWFGTQHGLSLLPKENITQVSAADKAKNVRQHLFTSFTTEDGLPNNFITQVIRGDGEKLYVGTNLGMCELLPAKGGQPSVKGWSVGMVFNTQHGYPVKDVNAGLNAMFKDSKGIIWIGTGSDKTGLVRFEPDAMINNSSAPPQLFINQVKLNNEAVSWRNIDAPVYEGITDSAKSSAAIIEEVTTYGKKLTDLERESLRDKFANIKFDGITKWQSVPQNLILPYYFNNISFTFGAIETGKNFLVNYKYFLKGYDKEWSPASPNVSANFGNMNEGNYTFLLKAQSPEGVWSQPVSYSFKVLPPWWRTWWMLAIYAILLIALVILFSLWRHKRIIYQKKILEHKVAVATKQVREEAEKVQVQKKKIEVTLNELKDTQAQLIQSEKMASLGELTAGIAHEIQNPLNFVNNFSDVNRELLVELKDEIDKGNFNEVKAIADDVIYNEEKINNHGKRADAIVKGMLQHSRSSNGLKEPTDINKLADEYLRLAYHGLRAKDKSFNATLKTDYDDNIGSINIIPQDMGRVILNLFTNAFYAVNEKVALSKASGDNDYGPLVSVSTKRTQDKVEIQISDNGNGIPRNIVDKIYQPFFTTKPAGQGTGLGLSMSYDIVTKAHGGSLKVETKVGEGTTFTICLNITKD
ncbi:MAG: hypothetical protein JWR72_1869 [Flavisolibacter sp.]|nr:hypothetical protein [Flavisolibacter sp.]